jgi:hypothetical protein
MSEEAREKRKGCTGKIPKKTTFEEFTYYKCPGNFYNPGFGQLIDLHRMYRKGVLFSAGGLMEQPAKYLDAMNFIEGLITQKEIDQMQKASKKNGRK